DSSGPGATVTLQLQARVTQASALTTLAQKTAQDQPDPHPANDLSSLQVVGQPVADLAVTVDDGVTGGVPGTALTYTVRVSNAGPDPVADAPGSAVLPATLSAATGTCSASSGSSCPASGTGTLSALVDLPVGGTTTFMLTATVVPGAAGTLTTTASVRAPAG